MNPPVFRCQPTLSPVNLRHGSPARAIEFDGRSGLHFTGEFFDGDLHVSYDFKINAHGGLALLMTQASGMQHEDFLNDYALRISGSLATVFGEDVRNYHWEFYREMCETRNDLSPMAL